MRLALLPVGRAFCFFVDTSEGKRELPSPATTTSAGAEAEAALLPPASELLAATGLETWLRVAVLPWRTVWRSLVSEGRHRGHERRCQQRTSGYERYESAHEFPLTTC